MSAITIRYENTSDSMLMRPFMAGMRHFQVAFCDDSQDSLMRLVKERVIYRPSANEENLYRSLTLVDRAIHLIAGTLETIGYVITPIAFFAFIVDKSLYKPILGPNELLLDFYRGTGYNSDGRSFDEIINWDDEQLEKIHDYIQWLFPNWEKSGANNNAPCLKTATPDLIKSLQDDPVCKKNLERAFKRMLDFYGLKLDEDTMTISRKPGHRFHWLTENDHNFKRLTRMIECLYRMGLDSYASAFQDILIDIAIKEGHRVVSTTTFNHWLNPNLKN